MHDEKTLKWFDRIGQRRPEHISHGVSDSEIRERMVQLKPKSWRLEGNLLKGMTEWGELVQTIPPDYICRGTDDQGLPILEKISLT